jgi:hypothetical protein
MMLRMARKKAAAPSAPPGPIISLPATSASPAANAIRTG